MADKPAPNIPTLVDDTVDLIELGTKNLLAYIRYGTNDEMDGDLVTFSWVGRTSASGGLDFRSIPTRVDKDQLPVEGLEIEIPNTVVVGLRDGQAFYSYTVDDQGVVEESKRLILFVGQRPAPAAHLPLPQVKEAHRGFLDPKAQGPVQIVVAPYHAMAKGDTVKLTWQAYQADGNPLSPYVNTKTLGDTDVGFPLSWSVSDNYFSGAADGRVEISYAVTYSTSGSTDSSRLQLKLSVPPDNRMPLPRIRDLTGDILDPAGFPNGAMIEVDPYPDIQVGDDVLVYWSAARPTNSSIQHVRIDQSNIDSRRIEFRIEKSVLDASIGGNVMLTWQYARIGSSASSEPRELSIVTPLKLAAPSVVEATPVAGTSTLDPLGVTETGATVRVPANPGLGPGDLITVIWDGIGVTGNFETSTPLVGGGLDFRIPTTAIPANLGNTFDVYYTVTRATVTVVSDKHRLFISEIALDKLPKLQCTESANTPGKLSRKTGNAANGAHFTLEPWVYIAVGQTVDLELSGLALDGASAVEYNILKDYAVLQSDVVVGVNHGELPMAILDQLKMDESFDVYVSVRFDDSASPQQFLTLKLTLID
ncbi:hypothetical protein [Pseudomonas abietaniphila]|uniref:Uncharacterized protein n=1 Tax=Pseudomonas abietaniphila TaxID=89065 RepID=A0A1G8UFI2_9PSED|nr:hypothetical protein [Pseudomonas abietaniphila]SDJ52509.1 hypothetical protein SAMN05216605_1362 [Pseudomonas abietaniphila]